MPNDKRAPAQARASEHLHSRRNIVRAGAALGAAALGFSFGHSVAAAAPPVLLGPLPDTRRSGVLVWDVSGLDYVAAEYLLSGRADVYRPVCMADAPDVASRDNTRDLGARSFSRELIAAAQPFTTRLIVYRPRDVRRFSGRVIVETLHPNGGGRGLVWDVLHGFFAAHGDAYVAVQHPLTFPGVKAADPARYGALAASSPTQLWGMLAQAGAVLKGGNERLLPGFAVKRLLMTGYSYTGVATATFANYHHSAATLRGRNLFDAYLPMANAQYVRPLDVPVMRLSTQSDYNGFGGVDNRRPDDDRYRHYEVAGASHVAVHPPADAATPPDAGKIPTPAGQPHFDESQCRAAFPSGSRPNDFPLDLVQAAMFDNMYQWLEGARTPPPSAFIDTQADGTTRFDEWGNALGGVRYPQVAVPIACYGVGAPGPCLLFGYTAPFSPIVCKSLYGTHARYLDQVAAKIDALVTDRWLLPAGAERLLTAARAHATFS